MNKEELLQIALDLCVSAIYFKVKNIEEGININSLEVCSDEHQYRNKRQGFYILVEDNSKDHRDWVVAIDWPLKTFSINKEETYMFLDSVKSSFIKLVEGKSIPKYNSKEQIEVAINEFKKECI